MNVKLIKNYFIPAPLYKEADDIWKQAMSIINVCQCIIVILKLPQLSTIFCVNKYQTYITTSPIRTNTLPHSC